MNDDKILKTATREVVIKNIMVVILALAFYNFIYRALKLIYLDQMSDLLTVISMLLVTVCFANFAFSYQHSDFSQIRMRWLAHLATFIFMLLIAVFLEIIVIIIELVYTPIWPLITLLAGLLYLGMALYDFWDFYRFFIK